MANKGRHGQTSHKGLVAFIVIIFIIAIIGVGAFVFREQVVDVYNRVLGTTTATTVTTTTEPTTVQETTTVPLDENTKKAQQMVSTMDTKAKICQLFVVTPEELTNVDVATVAGDTTKKKLNQFPVGGIVYFEKNKADDDAFADMVKKTKSFSKTPLFIMEDGKEKLFTYDTVLKVSKKLCDGKITDGSEAVKAFNNGNQILMML